MIDIQGKERVDGILRKTLVDFFTISIFRDDLEDRAC
jgi:hypothetical protein